MIDTDNGISSAMTELGIDPSTLDDGSDFETEVESTEAEGEVKEEVENTEPDSDDDSLETETPEGEEEQSTETAEVVEEEPKLTAKEFREIEAKRNELDAKEKAITERFATQEKELNEKYHEKVKTHDEVDAFLAHLANKDPELFDLFKAEFQDHQKMYSNPIQEQTRNEIQELRKELDSFKNKAGNEVTMTKLETEMNQAKATFGKEAEAAGLKVDWSKVEDAWADNPKLGLKNAFYAQYGEQMVKAAASKAKVEAVTKKVASIPKVATAGTVNRSNTSVATDYSKMSIGEVLRLEAQKFTGKKVS